VKHCKSILGEGKKQHPWAEENSSARFSNEQQSPKENTNRFTEETAKKRADRETRKKDTKD
jgi:hypothetical protein